MKKILLSLFVFVIFSVPAFAYDAAARVDTVGKTILNKNGIAITNVKFAVVSGAADNSSYSTNKVINISTNDLAYAGNDNEVAAVVANTLGHLVAGHEAKGNLNNMFAPEISTDTTGGAVTSMFVDSYSNSKYNKEADVIAVNLMSNSSYNPLALIVLLVKQNPSSWETIQGKPANGDRALNVYEYTNYAYPAKVKAGYNCNEYKTFLTFANSTISARNAKTSKKIEKEIQKYRKNSISQIAKFKTRGGISGWDAAYKILSEQAQTQNSK